MEEHCEQRTLTRAWWFVSFIFPLVCAAFAPLANLFGILSFCEPWVIFNMPTTRHAHNPEWTVALNGIALGLAVIANILLLMNFTHRIQYMLSQPITISFWYISGVLQIVIISITYAKRNKHDTLYTQAYYYALISCIMHLFNATLLLASLLPTLRWPIFRNTFPAYKPYMLLRAPQRTLMLQTLIFTLYLGLGGGIFAAIEGWTYLDGIYWTDYSLLTIGFGSDFLPTSPAAKIILVPYTAIGLLIIGLVVGSIRALFVDQFRERIVWGKEVVHHQRHAWWRIQAENQKSPHPRTRTRTRLLWRIITFWRHHKTPQRMVDTQIPTLQTPMKWSKDEWGVMCYLKKRVDTRRRYLSLLTTFSFFAFIWFGGALLFWIVEPNVTEQAGKFTYPLSLYFTYVSLLTIGYGDVIPRSRAGRPFFVVWSLASIPSMTLLISDIGDTFVKWVKEGPIENVFGSWLIGNVGEDQYAGFSDQEDGESEKEERDGGGGDGGDGGGDGGAAEEKKAQAGHFQLLNNQACVKQVRKAVILLHQVRKVIHDDERIQYTWEEWESWIKLLELDKDGGYEGGDISNWTWLGDEGPLLAAGGSEKLWLLEKFRQKLDEEIESLLK